MTPDQFEILMIKIAEEAENGDTEAAHADADMLMLTILRQHGYGKGADIFEEMEKWYGD